MVSKTILSVLFLLIGSSVFSQFSAGLNASGMFARTKSLKKTENISILAGGILMEIGLGLEMYGKYSFTPRLECEAALGHYLEMPPSSKASMSTMRLGGNFLLFTKTVRPYVGMGVTVLRYRYQEMQAPDYESDFGEMQLTGNKLNDFGFSFEPSIGILLDSGVIKNLFINPQLACAFSLKDDNLWQYYRANLGLVYYFNAKED